MTAWHPFPAELYGLVERSPGAVLLESALPDDAPCFSRLFLAPLRVLTAEAYEDVAALVEQIEAEVAAGRLAAGFFSYECGAAFEPAVPRRPVRSGSPLAWFGVYEKCFVFDHRMGTFVDGGPPELGEIRKSAIRGPFVPPIHLEPALDEGAFARSIETIHEWICAGDVYQLNFTFPLKGRFDGSPAALYAQLRSRQPVRYGAFLHWQSGEHVLSFSPELFFRVDANRRITTQPMKGTSPRGRTTDEDRDLGERLRNDPKNRAENVMIVDLLRNDLGRVCGFGSVRVENLFAVERYPTLWQMTSTVAGDLLPSVRNRDILRALFPCGSITGAPKVRAMQLIADVEPEPRGPYTGAIGFFSPEETAFNVAIRTIQIGGGSAAMGVGSGIVIDSVAALEYRECLLKAEFLADAVEPFSLIETMLWNGEFPLLDLHLDRLQDSADYFGFLCDRHAVRHALQKAVARLEVNSEYRVRLLLDRQGLVRVEASRLESSTSADPVRVCLSSRRTESGNRFLFHKTTNRALYETAFCGAARAGYADMLFLNERGEVTEGAISTIFLERAGVWSTPLLMCGLLPGVFRRHLLATRPGIQERILHIEDLRAADAVYLANAVRGLRRAIIDWDAGIDPVAS